MNSIDLFSPITEALTIELGDYQQVTDFNTFSQFTEGYTYKGQIFFNKHNLIFTEKSDFEHCKYYNQKGIVCELSLPTYEFNLYILAYGNSRLLKDAVSYKSDEYL